MRHSLSLPADGETKAKVREATCGTPTHRGTLVYTATSSKCERTQQDSHGYSVPGGKAWLQQREQKEREKK